MRDRASLPQQESLVHDFRPAAGDDRTLWAVVEDVAVGGVLCLTLWFLTSMAFLA
jgi:hypothetical protein